MASIKMTYVIQSCSRCHTQLLKVAAGSQIIGSPLLTCPGCGTVYRTNLRVEWYKYSQKWQLIGIPVLLTVGMLLVGAMMGEPAVGVMAAIFGFFIGLCFTIKDLIRMIASKKRMRDSAYLMELLKYQELTPAEYEAFMHAAGKESSGL